MPALRLGSHNDIRTSADLFEQCIEDYLKLHNIPFDNEEEQRRLQFVNREKKLTPDFRIKKGHLVTLSLNDEYGTSNRLHAIHWIEAKMFYGASTIPHDTNNAVGTILPKIRQYVQYYGSGAIVFMYGCGETLARDLMELGVVALDCRGIDLDKVVRHQRGWCGDGEGGILF